MLGLLKFRIEFLADSLNQESGDLEENKMTSDLGIKVMHE